MLLTEAHSGHRVTVRVRQEFVVRLLSNPSTGYSWTADAYTGINFARNRAGIGNLLTGLTKEASAIPYSHRAVWNWRWKDRTG